MYIEISNLRTFRKNVFSYNKTVLYMGHVFIICLIIYKIYIFFCSISKRIFYMNIVGFVFNK